MSVENIRVIIANELLEQFNFEGLLIHPLEPELAMLVLSSKFDSFNLQIYQLKLYDDLNYHIEKLLTVKSFSAMVEMEYFIKTFAAFNDEDFMRFIGKVTNESLN
ncbi:hypothetical protein [Metabacillus niabensis]|uniref:hypothetical protein n=1 Tax=Metabacillus niabensis TaxID=324854 RepID=UPI001CFC04FB|nr:hypothetical protein [Metabacillus niabensis]